MFNIILIGINFYPEDTAIGLYTTQMAEYLQEKGFNVSVITGFPYYPQWEVWDEYKNKPDYLEENYKGIKIYRYKQFTPRSPTFKNRISHILSFTFGNLRNLKKIKKADLLIAIVPFTSDMWLAYKLAKRTGAKIWVHIQDFEFDAAFETGVIKNQFAKKLVSKILYKIEKSLLDKADIVSTISYSMLEKAKNKTDTQLFYFPNWIDKDFINPEKARLHPYLKSKKFKILYSGNIGAKQDWETYLKIVDYFKDNEKIEFIIVGDGAKKDCLLEKIKKYENIKYYPPVPYEDLPDLLCSANLHILFQKDDVIDTVMPSKLLGMMASAKPSLVSGNNKSEIAVLFKKSKGGIFVKGTENAIVESILDLYNNNEKARQLGENARNFVVKNFSKGKVLSVFVEKVNDLLK